MQLLIWYYYAYYFMALVVSIVIIGSGMAKVVSSRKSQYEILSMATFRGDVTVLRDDLWASVSSKDLVPGDVIQIKADQEILALDCVLLYGSAVVDESSLTGSFYA
jgi:cation-transporting ATPase 13A3/4/5